MSNNANGRPTREARRRVAIARALEEFADSVPGLLVETTKLISDKATSPAVRVQLIGALEKLTGLLPDMPKNIPPSSPLANPASAESRALHELCLVGLLGRVEAIDRPFEPEQQAQLDKWRARTLVEVAEELGRRRVGLEAEERELTEQVARIDALRERLEANELRPLSLGHGAEPGGAAEGEAMATPDPPPTLYEKARRLLEAGERPSDDLLQRLTWRERETLSSRFRTKLSPAPGDGSVGPGDDLPRLF